MTMTGCPSLRSYANRLEGQELTTQPMVTSYLAPSSFHISLKYVSKKGDINQDFYLSMLRYPSSWQTMEGTVGQASPHPMGLAVRLELTISLGSVCSLANQHLLI